LLHSMPSRRQSCFAFSMISSTVGSDIINPRARSSTIGEETGRAQPGKAVKRPSRGFVAERAVRSPGDRAIALDGQSRVAMGITTFVLARARCFGQGPARACWAQLTVDQARCGDGRPKAAGGANPLRTDRARTGVSRAAKGMRRAETTVLSLLWKSPTSRGARRLGFGPASGREVRVPSKSFPRAIRKKDRNPAYRSMSGGGRSGTISGGPDGERAAIQSCPVGP
jgi:hypothetical protein